MNDELSADAKLKEARLRQEQATTRRVEIDRDDTDARLFLERAHADQAVSSRDDFLAMVSHDVRGLLGALTLSSTVLAKLAEAGERGERLRTEVGRIERIAARMNRLVGDLLDIVSIESGKLAVGVAVQNPAPLVTETVATFVETADARGVRLTNDVSAVPLVAPFDRDRILQVLANLVGNALKFVKPGGEIALGLAASDGGVEFTVRDDGCGIPPDQTEAIFERFARAGRRARGGLGLGLHISRCIVEAHGGRIWAERAPERGSVFHFTLPGAGASRTRASELAGLV